MKEYEMSKPVEDFFKKQGYKVYCEVPYYHNCIDMVLSKDNEIVCVELKKQLNKSLYHQVAGNLANKSIGIVATRPRKNNIWLKYFKNNGLYLYFLDLKNNKIELIIEGKDQTVNIYLIEKMKFRIKNREEGGIAGHKTEKNSGACYPLALKIIEYRKTNPKANWEEFYNNISNQYCNYKSMMCAMSKYIKKRFKKDGEQYA